DWAVEVVTIASPPLVRHSCTPSALKVVFRAETRSPSTQLAKQTALSRAVGAVGLRVSRAEPQNPVRLSVVQVLMACSAYGAAGSSGSSCGLCVLGLQSPDAVGHVPTAPRHI